MGRIPQCNGCKNDGRCQYQDLDDCQCCEQELNKGEIKDETQ